jgi:hypothetical protein
MADDDNALTNDTEVINAIAAAPDDVPANHNENLTDYVRRCLGMDDEEKFSSVLGASNWMSVTSPIMRAYRIDFWANIVAFLSLLALVITGGFDLLTGLVPGWLYSLLAVTWIPLAFLRQTGLIEADRIVRVSGAETQLVAYDQLRNILKRIQSQELMLEFKLGPLSDDGYQPLPATYFNSNFSIVKLLGKEGEEIYKKRGFWHTYYRDIIVRPNADAVALPNSKVKLAEAIEPSAENTDETDPPRKTSVKWPATDFLTVLNDLASGTKCLRQLTTDEVDIFENGVKAFDDTSGVTARAIVVVRAYLRLLPKGRSQTSTIGLVVQEKIVGASSVNTVTAILIGKSGAFNDRVNEMRDRISTREPKLD